MTIYNTVFGGSVIQPSQTSYNPMLLTANVTLTWPLETAPNGNLLTSIIDIMPATAAGYNITLPPANQASTGQAFIINNRSSFAQAVFNNSGAVIIASLAAGSVFFLYVQDNSTAAGLWGNLQYGSAVSTPSVAAIAGPGLQAVGSQLAQNIAVSSKSGNYVLGVNDRTQLFNWIGGVGNFTLPLAGTVGANWYVQVRNSGSSALTLLCAGSDTINGAATSLIFNPGDSAFVVTDGATWYTIGFGNAQTNQFQFLLIDLTGLSGTYTLAGVTLNKVAYRFSGALAGNIKIVVPATVQQYWIDNQTSGAFTLSIGTAAQAAPPSIAQGSRSIFYCDGVNVVNASTAGLAVPIAVNQGGTGAITAGAALTNLGGTSIGIALFTTASAAAAQASIVAPSFADAMVGAQVW